MSELTHSLRNHSVSRGVALDMAIARLNGAYALGVYLPVSNFGKQLRTRLRRLRGVASADAPDTRLPRAAWSQVLERRPIRIIETAKRDGNVRLSELAMLAQAASNTPPGSEIVEIGTFDGRTTLNLAINAPRGVSISTLDLPPDQQPAMAMEPSERRYVSKPAPGARLHNCRSPWWVYADRVAQMHGDSATFDWTAHYGRAGLVFVDGSHAYDYVRRDSETAMRLVKSRGVVIWHDYGVWPGVTRALEELEATHHLGLVHISGTSLVIWRAPNIVEFVPDAPAGQDYEDELHLAPVEASVELNTSERSRLSHSERDH